MAHLIRDVKFLTTLPDASVQTYGTRLREALRALFGVIHRREQLTAQQFQSQLEAARAEVLRCATSDVPASPHCRNLAKRFETHGESYFRFITTPGVEPTNNLAEQAIRFVVIDRLITQGTRSEKGNRWCERIWTVIATCTQQGRSVFEYLEAAVGAWFADTAPPMLLAWNLSDEEAVVPARMQGSQGPGNPESSKRRQHLRQEQSIKLREVETSQGS